jgi:glyoxylase-like metal-dependent hydrolase (beta-lactamase superfamily II)/ferredoxin
MARVALRNRSNVEGEWFVDTRCIDCGTCRDIAPGLFGDVGDMSVMIAQPADDASALAAWLAAQACPTTSIGTVSHQTRPGRLYPREIEAGTGVFDLGYCSEDSFGASAWFLQRDEGNLLVDSPRFTEALVAPIEAAGGIAHVLLTHRDDVADADRWAARFGARVWIHRDDLSAARFATDVVEAIADTEIAPGVVAVPTPGHTRGSMVFVIDERFLFTGDSLAWSHARQDLTAFRDACWYSSTAQTESLERLAVNHRFEWVLPGHGARMHADPLSLHERLVALVGRMRS